jgi:16S rRNA (guanine527-N7)-methyltransferase
MNEKFDKFISLLFEYNKTHSITAFKNKEIARQNIQDSIYVKTFLKKPSNVLDIGSGAGFPAIALAIVYPDIHFTLTEPINKKNAFLLLVKTILKLDNVTIFPHRVEKLQDKKFDLITSRAVAKTSFLVNLAKPYLQKNGIMLFYKGENVVDEINDLSYEIIENKNRKYLIIKDDEC